MASGKGRLWVTAIIAVAVVVIAAVIVLYPHEIDVTSEGDGKVIPSGDTEMRFTETLRLEIVPGEDTVTYVYVDGELKAQDVTSYEFRVSALDFDKHTIKVVFQKETPPEPEKEFTLSVTSEGEGTATPSGEAKYAEGTVVTVKAMPGSGNVVGDIIIDGVSAGPGGSVQVRMDSDHDVKVVFRPVAAGDVPVTISVDVDLDIVVETLGAVSDYGEVVPSGTVYVAPHGSLTVTVILNPGFEMKDMTVDGVSYGAVTEHTITDITKSVNVEISIIKKVQGFVIKTSAGTGGSISPSGDVKVEKGKDMTFTFTPASGYKVSTLTVDGKTIALTSNSYTFTDVQSAHTIAVTFQATGGGGGGGSGGTTKTLTGITVTQKPTELIYNLNLGEDTFDPSGMEVEASFSDSTSSIVPNGSCVIDAPESFTTLGDVTITISYTYGTVTKSDSFVVKVVNDAGFSVTVTDLSGTRINGSGSVETIDDWTSSQPLNRFHFQMGGIVPGITQTATMEVKNESGTAVHAYIYITDKQDTGLGPFIFLQVKDGDSTLSQGYVSNITNGQHLDLGVIQGNETKTLKVTLSFPITGNDNGAMGKQLSFKLGIFADIYGGTA